MKPIALLITGAVIALSLLGCSHDSGRAARDRSPADAESRSLNTGKLVKIAQRHALPMPPKEARLVLAHTETWSMLGNRSTSRDPGIYSPAYLLEVKPNGSVLVLRGTERETLEARHPREPLWRPFSTTQVEPKLGGHVADFARLSAFVCAVQTAALGQDETAERIWKRFSAAEWWSDGRFGDQVESQVTDPARLLARCIFDHLRNGLRQHDADWKLIHKRMKALFEEFPKLNRGWRSTLFSDLATTVNAAPPRPGSIEALLLDWSRRPSHMRHLGIFHEGRQSDADSPARRIVRRGYGAVPGLLRLLDDRRITAHECPAIMNSPARIRRVGELARQLVRQIAGDQAAFRKYGDDMAAIRAWWRKARGQDEAASLLQGVFTRKGNRIMGVNETPVRILAVKFPEKLPALCDEFSEHATPSAQPYALAEALAASSLPKETRVRVLSEFARRGSLEHKRCVLQNLAKLDAHACTGLLLPLLGTLPTDAGGPYWTCPEAHFTHVVMELENDKVWREYLRIARRSSVGLRMEMMNPLNYRYIGKRNRGRRLAFLAAFLDDHAVREMSGERGKFQGPCAGFSIPRLHVRDFAATGIAAILGMEESPDEFWTEAQWKSLRQKVRERLAQEKLPDLVR